MGIEPGRKCRVIRHDITICDNSVIYLYRLPSRTLVEWKRPRGKIGLLLEVFGIFEPTDITPHASIFSTWSVHIHLRYDLEKSRGTTVVRDASRDEMVDLFWCADFTLFIEYDQ